VQWKKHRTPRIISPPATTRLPSQRLDHLPQIRCVEIAATMSSADENEANNGVAVLLLGVREQTTASSPSLAEKFYISRGCSLKTLAILSLGLVNEDGNPIFDINTLPWSSA